MNLTLEQSAEPNLELLPEARLHLEALLSTYASLKFDLDAIQHQIDIEKLAIGQILDEAGVTKASTDDYSLYWTRDKTTKKLDKKKLMAQGVTPAQITAATTEKPKKDSFTIRGKSEKPEDTEE